MEDEDIGIPKTTVVGKCKPSSGLLFVNEMGLQRMSISMLFVWYQSSEDYHHRLRLIEVSLQ